MKFLKLSYLLTCFGALFLFSCKNELNVNAPYKDVPSIYAVLNPQENLQIIRINKTFLGEGDANQMAQVADSINYPAGELSVTLERYVNGVKTTATTSNNTPNNQIIIFHDSILQTVPGAFNTNQRVYVSSAKLFTSGEYRLTVKNNKTQKIFTAKNNAIDSIRTSNVIPFTAPFYPVVPGSVNPNDPAATAAAYIDYSNQNLGYSPKFKEYQAAIYTMKFRFHFYDYPSGVGIDSVAKYVDYNFGNKYLKDQVTIQSNKYLAFDFKGQDLFNALDNSLSKLNLNTFVARKMYKMQIFVYSSTQDYVDYMQFTSPSLSIAQEKPIYSNFDNRDAMGIFTFRTRYSIYKEMASPFVSQFSFNQYTCKYHFLTAANFHQGCP